MIKELNGYSQKLASKLTKDDITLSLSDDGKALLSLLPNTGDYTYLILDDGISREVVRAYNDAGEILIQRGQGDTEAYTFPKGTCVKWEMTGAWISAFVCQLECKPDPLPSDCGCSDCC